MKRLAERTAFPLHSHIMNNTSATLEPGKDYSFADLLVRNARESSPVADPELGFFARETDEHRDARAKRQDRLVFRTIAVFAMLGFAAWMVALAAAFGV
ncbi:hypothetical protein BDW02DRAFT_570380 [Decorospora gaudefroyi]|uniref:Uncharacterized protein n=1 Tax=Decorospora gaudefroyi TaxID=184978 RepID=A0A6A5KAT3_9PLEO|nr:hypothetical protein BDW02DRAFT_570380 [Decorospora gaudefroyi]